MSDTFWLQSCCKFSNTWQTRLVSWCTCVGFTCQPRTFCKQPLVHVSGGSKGVRVRYKEGVKNGSQGLADEWWLLSQGATSAGPLVTWNKSRYTHARASPFTWTWSCPPIYSCRALMFLLRAIQRTRCSEGKGCLFCFGGGGVAVGLTTPSSSSRNKTIIFQHVTQTNVSLGSRTYSLRQELLKYFFTEPGPAALSCLWKLLFVKLYRIRFPISLQFRGLAFPRCFHSSCCVTSEGKLFSRKFI